MKRFCLPLILLLAFTFRIILLGSYPSGFTPDEASFGYDAYSILKTGKDQWGKSLPLVLESFGDFKAPLYAYLDIPFIALFGLNPVAVRLPNALLSSLAVLVLYLLVKELFKKEGLALISGLMLAVSPWHLPLSRGAFEANLTTFFLPLGILLFLKKKYFWSGLIFGLNLFTYHSARLITPILVIFLLILFKKFNKAFLTTFLIFLGLAIYTFFLGAGRRAADINVFKGSLIEGAEKRIAWINQGANPLVAHAIYNKYTISLKRFSVNYFSYFSPRFLFLRGPAEATYGMLPGKGVLYLVEAISLAIGLVLILRGFKKNNFFLVLLWLLVSPIPAALSAGVGYAANRVAVMMPAIQIISALGINFLFKKRKVLGIILGVLVFFQAVCFYRDYFGEGQKVIARQMLFGNLAAMKEIKTNYSDQEVLVSTQLSEPQIYWAFVSQISPKVYQAATKDWDYQEKNLPFLDQLASYNLEKVTFKRIGWEKDSRKFSVLVGRPDEFPKEARIEKIIYYPDGKEALYLVGGKSYQYAKTD